MTDGNTRLQAGSRVVGITMYPSGKTYLTASTSSGLVSTSFPNTLTRMR
ncbi:hypothetical protein [Loktanella fryxellensis]|nr:hypothetical protein [Loktanella fryxellensis]